jgi:hypothetical protein
MMVFSLAIFKHYVGLSMSLNDRNGQADRVGCKPRV